MIRWLAKLLLKLWGFKITGNLSKDIKKKVVAVVPHTSNWDFPLGVLVRAAAGIDVNYVGKSSLFRPPFGWFFRMTGGVPVNRKESSNFVDAIVEVFNGRENFSLCLAPEGTRNKVDKLRTGFYYIAHKAKVPIVLVKFDWENRIVDWRNPLYPTGDIERDMEVIHDYFKGTKGKIPENSFSPA